MINPLLAAVALAFAVPAAAQTPEQTMRSLAQHWLVEQDIDKAMALVDTQAMAQVIKENAKDPTFRELAGIDLNEYTRKWLVMWLFKDHGLVDTLGHGRPSDAGYARLPSSPAGIPAAGRVRYATVEDALPPGISVAQAPDKPEYHMAILGLRHAPRDGVVFVLKQVQGEWKIVGFMSFAG